VNYFGRVGDIEKIALKPVLIRKGGTKLALYGLGHVRDERLARSFEHKGVSVARAVPNPEEWFSLMVIHQNRHPRGVGTVMKGYIKDGMLPSCMDMIAGGMHALVESSENQFIVMQPGSTVATSLVEAEAKPKHVALLQIRGEEFKMEAVPLCNVRPFAIKEVALADFETEYNLHGEEGLMQLFHDQVEAMLADLAAQRPPAPLTPTVQQLFDFPLIRLKVDYSGYSTCNPQKFGQRFVGRTKIKRKERQAAGSFEQQTSDARAAEDEEDPSTTIQHLVERFLRSARSGSLRLLRQEELNRAVFHDFVMKEEKGAIANRVEAWLKHAQTSLDAEIATAAIPEDRKGQEQAVEDRISRRGGGEGRGLGVRSAGDMDAEEMGSEFLSEGRLGPVSDAASILGVEILSPLSPSARNGEERTFSTNRGGSEDPRPTRLGKGAINRSIQGVRAAAEPSSSHKQARPSLQVLREPFEPSLFRSHVYLSGDAQPKIGCTNNPEGHRFIPSGWAHSPQNSQLGRTSSHRWTWCCRRKRPSQGWCPLLDASSCRAWERKEAMPTIQSAPAGFLCW
ncbi:MAG: hypothetical protein SGPRY_013292, partial [Prymnesium sp.]